MSNGGNPDVTVGSNAFDVSNSFVTGKLGSALEAGGGITGRLSNKVSIYGEVSYRSPLDSSGLSGVQGNVGVRVAF
jgi:outer membrane autotransporter protein